MKELVVISGKGGTGKTSVVAAFSSLSENKVLCDADVDASDLHLIMNPEVKVRQDFQGGAKAVIDPEMCSQCGLCVELCRWGAINDRFEVDSIACEGCGVCAWFCPEKAIDLPPHTCGQWFISDSRFGPFVHARLGIAEENSGKLVTIVRQKAKELAEENKLDLILTDGPPGVGCPVIASIGGASALLIVTEPTLAGKHDMERVAGLAAHFKVPAMICVNKFDLNLEETEAIETTARQAGLKVLGRVPFDPQFVHAMVKGQTIIEFEAQSPAAQAVRSIWKEAVEVLSS